MPYKIEWIGKYTVVVFSGIVTYQELRETGDAHYGDSRLDSIKYIISDFTGADLSQISLHEPTIIASLDSVAVMYKPELRMAFVVRDDHQQMLCEKYIESSIGFQSSWSHQIVFSFDEARKWCELPNSSDN
jgi:hypothetical protein